MGTVRTKGHEHLPPPLYPPEYEAITLVLHYGGQFVSKPTADYIGGDKVVYDYLNILDVRIANLSKWCEDLGVIGEKKFYGIFENGFKWLWDDYELIAWARGFESTRQVHVWVEGDVQKGSDQSLVHKASETFEVQNGSDQSLVHKASETFEVQNGSDQSLVHKASETFEVQNGSDQSLVHKASETFEVQNGSDQSLVHKASETFEVQNGSDQSLVHKATETFEVQNGSDQSLVLKASETFEVQKGSDEDHEMLGDSDEGEMSGDIVTSDEDFVCDADGFDDTTDSDEDFVYDEDARELKYNNGVVFNPSSEVGMVFETKDETMGSDEDFVSDNNGRELILNNEVVFDPSFAVGMVFQTKHEFKKAIQSHAIQTKRSLHTARNDKIRVYVRCRSDGCDWGINLCKRENKSIFYIKKYKPTHRCAPTIAVRNLNSKWVAERYVSAFLNDYNGEVESLRNYIMRELNVNVSKQQVYRARRKVLKMIEGLPDEQYSKLRNCAKKWRIEKCTHQYLTNEKMSSSCTQAAGGEEESVEPVCVTKRQKLKLSWNESASTSKVTRVNATDHDEDFIVSGPLTREKTRGRPPKVSGTPTRGNAYGVTANATNHDEDFSVSGPLTRWKTRGRSPKVLGTPTGVNTSGVTNANAVNQEDFIVSGPLTRRKTRGRPPKVLGTPTGGNTSGVTHANATNPVEDFIVSGTPPRGNTNGVTHANATGQKEDFIVSEPLTRRKRGRPPKVLVTPTRENTSGVAHANATNPEEDFHVSGTPPRGNTNVVTHANAIGQEEDFIVSEPFTRRKRGRPPKVLGTPTSGDTRSSAINPVEDFIVNEPPTSGKTRGRPCKVSGTPTSGVITHANATNPEKDFVVSGPPTTEKTGGRPYKLNIDLNAPWAPKSPLGLVDEDEDNEFEALLNLASSATGLGKSTISPTRSHTPYTPIQLPWTPPSISMPPMLSGPSVRPPPPFLRRCLRPHSQCKPVRKGH